MEGDRLAILVRRVAGSGRLNLAKFDPLDRLSHIRLNMALNDEGTALSLQAWQTIQSYNLGLASMGGDLEFEFRKQAMTRAHEAMQKCLSLLLPWLHKPSEVVKPDVDAIRKLTAQWEEAWGKLDSPETKERIARTVRWLNANTAR